MAIAVEGTVNTVLFPFVPFLVADTGVAAEDVGYYAGLLASIFNIAQFFSAVWWGKLSDKIGRKPILYLSMASLAVTTIIFGLSQTLTQAMLARAAAGTLTGTGPVARSLIRDVTPEEHRTRAFSSVGTAFGVSFLIGPMIGGTLAKPATSMPWLFGGSALFVDFPYLLPCLSVALGTIPAVICLLRVEEPPVASKDGGNSGAAASKPAGGAQGGGAQGGGAQGVELTRPSSAEAVRDLDSGSTLSMMEVASLYSAAPFEALGNTIH